MPDLSTRRIIMASRPRGVPQAADFRLEEAKLTPPGEGEVLGRTIWLSLDPYMRGRMSDAPSYARPVPVGGMLEAEVVGEVEESRDPAFRPGDIVAGYAGWQSRFVLPADQLRKIDPGIAPISTALGVLGMPGMTAYVGLKEIARPRAGETVVIGAASGAVGAVAGQMARILGCHVVGVAGGAEKCRYCVEELGFDQCLDRRQEGLAERLREACPRGIDIYVELTGGELTWAVLPLMNQNGRIPVIGTIAWYNLDGPSAEPDHGPQLLRTILVRRLLVQGMIVSDHFSRLRAEFEQAAGAWVKEGRLRYKEDVVVGLENAPEAFMGLLAGRNFGKLLVRVGPDPAK
jgi:NADPH-dependent curcumin reductase